MNVRRHDRGRAGDRGNISVALVLLTVLALAGGGLIFDGVRYLADDRVDGTDPLIPFGPHAADHLRRTSSFDNCPDLLVNSFYDPATDEGAAFEELIGFHGGLGGRQSHPFILAPVGLPEPTEELVGALSVHRLFKSWLAVAQGTASRTPVSE